MVVVDVKGLNGGGTGFSLVGPTPSDVVPDAVSVAELVAVDVAVG